MKYIHEFDGTETSEPCTGATCADCNDVREDTERILAESVQCQECGHWSNLDSPEHSESCKSGNACDCATLDDDLIEEGWTCYKCYEANR
jgi:hypothetical protein